MDWFGLWRQQNLPVTTRGASARVRIPGPRSGSQIQDRSPWSLIIWGLPSCPAQDGPSSHRHEVPALGPVPTVVLRLGGGDTSDGLCCSVASPPRAVSLMSRTRQWRRGTLGSPFSGGGDFGGWVMTHGFSSRGCIIRKQLCQMKRFDSENQVMVSL